MDLSGTLAETSLDIVEVADDVEILCVCVSIARFRSFRSVSRSLTL